MGEQSERSARPVPTISQITILRMGTPDDTDELECLACGMKRTAESRHSPDPVWKHLVDHHNIVNVLHVSWHDRSRHFSKYRHDPKPCPACGTETVSAESGHPIECLCDSRP